MKVLIVSHTDIVGGAARSAYRIHRALLDNNVKSRMLVLQKHSDDLTIDEVSDEVKIKVKKSQKHSRKIRRLFKIIERLLFKYERPIYGSFNMLNTGIDRIINEYDVDVVNLHLITDSMVGIRELNNINKPVVWTFHDLWALTGAEHYFSKIEESLLKCEYWEASKNRKRPYHEIGYWVWKTRIKHWTNKTFQYVITPSQWMKRMSNRSALFHQIPTSVIPTPLDTDIFRPMNKTASRKALNLPLEGNIIGFIASNVKDKNKGIQYLNHPACIEELQQKKVNCQLVILGGEKLPKMNYVHHFLGSIKENKVLIQFYSAIDVLVVPSQQENLPCVVAECLATGTPVVAFNIGGMPDMIQHKKHGYLAIPFDPRDIATGIVWGLRNKDKIDLQNSAINHVKKYYTPKNIAKQYVDVYEHAVSGSNRKKTHIKAEFGKAE